MLKQKKFAHSLLLAVLLTVSGPYASANSLKSVTGMLTGFNSFSSNSLQIKSSQPYDESKDPALRKGTENWEQSQESFFIVPGVILGIVVVFWIFNRNKSD